MEGKFDHTLSHLQGYCKSVKQLLCSLQWRDLAKSVFFFFLEMLESEHKVSCMLVQISTSELHPDLILFKHAFPAPAFSPKEPHCTQGAFRLLAQLSVSLRSSVSCLGSSLIHVDSAFSSVPRGVR